MVYPLTKECDCSEWTVVEQNGVDHSEKRSSVHMPVLSATVTTSQLGVEIDLTNISAHWALEIRELEGCDS